jgi:aspartate ammonia-lyase
MNTRIDHDLLGAKEVPAQAYWGVHTARAIENFPITGTSIGRYADLIAALAAVKQAAARTNAELGLLDAAQAEAIEAACAEIRAVQLADQFVVDVIAGRGGNVDQHERERGHLQPRVAAHGPAPRRSRVPALSRQHGPVHQ